jgi:uncharacterized repeat protein (TIGR03803 family)
MRPNLLRIAMNKALTLIALALILASWAWAQPKFKILATVPGGLWSGVSFDAKGNLYGTTTGGGTQNKGTIFQLSPGTHDWALKIIHSFDGYDGGGGNGGLIFDAAGNMFGTSPSGGTGYDGGNVFEMIPGTDGWTFNVLYNFCLQYHCPDGGNPSGGLVMDGFGNLYGAAGGGAYGDGVVFELTPGGHEGGWSELVLYDFTWRRGAGPLSPLVFDAAGNFYGTTFRGGAYGGGSVFMLQRAVGGAWVERVLYSFCSAGPPLCKDGVAPNAGVVFDTSGSLYGTTTQGGGNTCGETTCGTVFKLTPTRSGRWKHTVLYSFPSLQNGGLASSGVVFDKVGNLYGTTAEGGIGGCFNGCGVVYRLSSGTDGKWKYTVLHKFDSQAESPSDGGLIIDNQGDLYGTAYSIVYEIIP